MGKQQSKMRKRLIRRLAKETHFSEEEVRLWYKGFLKDCPNGMLSRKSFLKIYQTFFPNGDCAKFANLVFRVFDENQDGYIEFDEFIRALSVTGRGNLDEKLLWAFKLFDLDEDGFITREEMSSIVEAIDAMLGNATSQSIDPKDANNEEGKPAQSSTIQIESSKERIDKIFLKLDRNHDNRLSLEEFMQGTHDPIIIKALYMNNLNQPT